MERKTEAIFRETVFTMEAEGFVLTDKEKNALLDVLADKISFQAKLQEYIDKAKRRAMLKSITGIIKTDVDVKAMKDERIAKRGGAVNVIRI